MSKFTETFLNKKNITFIPSQSININLCYIVTVCIGNNFFNEF